MDFDKSDDTSKANEYLVKVLSKSSSCTTFDECRQVVYHRKSPGNDYSTSNIHMNGSSYHEVKICHEACQQLPQSHIQSATRP